MHKDNNLKSRLERWIEHKTSKREAQEKNASLTNKRIPLSFGQLRLWLLQQMNPDSPVYVYAESYQIKGNLNVEKFIRSFKKVVERHDILRTTFPSDEGKPWQKVHTTLEPEITVHRDHEILIEAVGTCTKTILLEQATKPFDLTKGPLVRLVIVQIDRNIFDAAVIMHHIITDKWSMNTLRKEWVMLYHGNPLDRPGFQYADFAVEQRNKPINIKHLKYWEEKLAGDLPVIELPVRKTPTEPKKHQGAFLEMEFSSEQSRKLQELSNRLQVTGFTLFLTIFKILLYRYSGMLDLLVATPVTNRDRTSLEKVIGFFNETVLLRSALSSDMTFHQALNNVKQSVLEAFEHKNVPFEMLVRNLKPERLFGNNPLFQVMFLYHKSQGTPLLDENISWDYQTMDLGVAKFDLTLYVSETNGEFSSVFEYDSQKFEKSTIERMHEHLQTMVDSILCNPDYTISELPISPALERKMILEEWGNNSTQYSAELVHKIIAKKAYELPSKPAVIHNKRSITYEQLQSTAEAIAHELCNKGVGTGQTVGIATTKSVEMVTAILGVLNAGAAYVPLDIKYPQLRLKEMAQEAGIAIILTESDYVNEFLTWKADVICLDNKRDQPIRSDTLPKVDLSDTAYVIFTSGSSGKPKGVPVSHQNLSNSTSARFSFYPDQPGTFLLMSSFSFDSSVAGIFWTLSTGGTLVLPQENLEQDINGLAALISRQQVTHTLMLPTLYELLLNNAPVGQLQSLNTVIVAGEACNAKTCISHFEKLEKVNLFNEYGPTEGTVWSIAYKLQPEDNQNPIPIGRPIPNSSAYILDKNLQPVPPEVIGHLYIGGAGVVNGYLNNEALTSERFIENPFDSTKGKLYCTGDLARFKSDGIIEFLGRSDHQIKIRGYRIETSEIQSVLQGVPGVLESAIVVQKTHNNNLLEASDVDDIDKMSQLLTEMDSRDADDLLSSIESINRFDNAN
jgi:amino acid adenylation domain-containing protein